MNDVISRIAAALMVDYTSVYYIDMKNSHYECYGTNMGGGKLKSSGEDFFADLQRDIRDIVYADDRDVLSSALTRESLLQQFQNNNTDSIEFRLMIDGQPIYHTMRILHDISEEDSYVILGLKNVDEAVRTEQMTRTYNAIAKTLASGYATIYYVDLRTNRYMEYSSSSDYKNLEVPPEGDDFFVEAQKNVRRVIHPEDRDHLMSVFNKDNIIHLTEHGRKYQTEYRMLLNGETHHTRMKAMHEEKGGHIIIAVENIDVEVKQREELKMISEQSVIFTHVAESLARQYGMIYYIDAETDDFIEFTAADEYKEVSINPSGSDFFATAQRNVSLIAYPSDRERLFDALVKKNMLKKLEENGSFTLTYQLMLAGGNSYTRMSVFWANDKKHLIMGVQNIDNEVQRENALKKMVTENAIFSQIAESLANQYDTIYYVDMLSDRYLEFTSTDIYKNLDVSPKGDNYFTDSLVNIERVIYAEDREYIRRILNKVTMIKMLQDKHMISQTYRLLVGDTVMYARMSIIWATDNKHVIVGIMNIDQEVRKEQEVQKQLHIANEKAYRDEMTGVKNKTAYQEFGAQLQDAIDSGSEPEFAIVVCDLNGLKTINDLYGHIEGDAYIKRASQLICSTWIHSPVFRVGGDEFTVIVQGKDYANRDALLEKIKQQNLENKQNGGVVVAVGMTDYVPGADKSVAEVFERADNLMYQNKSALKAKKN